MTLQVHGAIIDKRTTINSVAEFETAIKYTQTDSGDVATVLLCRKGEVTPFVTIPVALPHKGVFTESNWPYFLHYIVQMSPDKKLKNSKGQTGFSQITSRYHLGSIYFQIKTEQFVFGMIITDSETKTLALSTEKVKDIGSVSVFDNLFDDGPKTFVVKYSRTKLMVNMFIEANLPKFNADDDINDSDFMKIQKRQFVIGLNSQMSEAQLLISCIKGDSSIELKPEMFVNDDSSMKDGPDNRLFLKNIGTFYWLESRYGYIRCSITKNPALQATNAILNFIDDWTCSPATKTNLITAFTNRLRLYGNNVGDQASNILKACVAFKQDFELHTGHSIVTLKPTVFNVR